MSSAELIGRPYLSMWPVESGWLNEWTELMRDEWLRIKLKRNHAYSEHLTYIGANMPELPTMTPGVVVDIGPGVGILLELARYWGHRAVGYDAPPDSASGMGSNYLRACELMWQRQGLTVHRVGGCEAWESEQENVVLVNFRGSFEQTFAYLFDGVIDKQSKFLNWNLEQLPTEFDLMWRGFRRQLRSDGVVLINENHSANGNAMRKVLHDTARANGFTVTHSNRMNRFTLEG